MNNKNKKTILLVEDETIIAMDERFQLEMKGYIVHHVTNGEYAVKTILENKHPIDLILMDIDLGYGIDGTQAAEQILKHKDIPIVFLSSHTEADIVERTEKITSYGYVVKNSNITVLDASIKMAFKLFEAKVFQKNLEKELSNNKILMQAAFDQSPVAMAVVTYPDYTFKIVNKAAEDLLLVSAEDYVNKTPQEVNATWKDCYKNGDLIPFSELPMPAALQGITKKNMEIFVERHDGSKRIELVSGAPIYSEDGKLLAGLIVMIDVTEIKDLEIGLLKAKVKAEESEILFRTLVEQSPFSIQILHPNGKMISGNNAFCDLWNVSKADMEILLREYNILKDNQLEMTGLMQYVKQGFAGEFASMPVIFYDPQNTSGLSETKLKGKWVKGYIWPVLDDLGKIIQVVLMHEDITDRKQAEIALHESESTFRKLFEDSSDAILLIDHTGVFVECNQAALNLLKMTRQQFIMLPPARISPEFQSDGRLSSESAPEMIALAYSKGNHRFDWTCVNTEGGEFIVEVSLMPVVIKGQTMLHTTWRDVTKRKQAEEEIRKQLSEKEILLKEVHHRIKNNIASIESLLSLQANSTNNTDVKAALNDALSRVQSMRVLYDKLLIGKDYQEVSIKVYTESLIEAIVAVFPENGKVTVEKQISNFNLNTKKLIPVGIILNELLTNVFKYAFIGKNNGHISINLDKVENHINLTIQDNGNGIDEKFDLRKSSGFGITIVRILTEQLKGTYTMENYNGTRSILKFDI